ncbi:MAG: hypothetical protein ACYS0I_20410 [Planctomycetota bacterium]|jgi:hypothetical protein
MSPPGYHCVFDAVKELMEELGQDFSKGTPKARDFWKCGERKIQTING